MIAVDQTTIDYVKGRPYSPTNSENEKTWDNAVEAWRDLHTDDDAEFDEIVRLHAGSIEPQVTWGTSPEMVLSVNSKVPDPANEDDAVKSKSITDALTYMGLTAGEAINEIQIDKVFIGSCTNSRIEDMRQAAVVAKGKKVASNVTLAMVVPGSGLVKKQAEEEGLDKIFLEAGF